MTKARKKIVHATRKVKSTASAVKNINRKLTNAQLEAQIALLEEQNALLLAQCGGARQQTADGSLQNSAVCNLPSGGVIARNTINISNDCRSIWTTGRRWRVVERSSSSGSLTFQMPFSCRSSWFIIRRITASTTRWNIAGECSNDIANAQIYRHGLRGLIHRHNPLFASCFNDKCHQRNGSGGFSFTCLKRRNEVSCVK